MDENKKTVEDVKVEGTGEVGTQANENKDEGKAEKTYTQEEYNALDKKLRDDYKKKLERAMDGVDIKAYKDWLESQKTAEQKQAEKEAEYKQKDNTISELQKENAVLRAGVKDTDDVDYILFKVSKMEGEFEENLAKFLGNNPKYLKGEELKTEPKATGAPVKTLDSSEANGVQAILRARHPELYEK